MISLLSSIFGFVVCIFILVFIHELGHYSVARLCKVRVLEFAIGFGKTIYSKTVDDTVYAIRAIPLGGFVKMYGDDKSDVEPEFSDEAFCNKTLWQKAAIVFAGPLFNFILAIIVFFGLNNLPQEKLPADIGYVTENSVGASLGFKEGQSIVSVDGRQHEYWSDNRNHIIKQAIKSETVTLTVEDHATLNQATIVLDFSSLNWAPEDGELFRFLGVEVVKTEPIIEHVSADKPAGKAGLEPGDVIVSIDEKVINTWQDMAAIIFENPDNELSFVISRNGNLQSMEIIPEKVMRNGLEYGLVGISPKLPEINFVSVNLGFWQAMTSAVNHTYDLIVLTLTGLGQMIVGNMSIDNISGPITIADYAGKTVQSGLISYLSFIAFISISLGVINLMPVPVLDGGHLVMFGIEAITGKTLSDNVLRIWQSTGVALLLMLMVVAFYNDIVRLVQ